MVKNFSNYDEKRKGKIESLNSEFKNISYKNR